MGALENKTINKSIQNNSLCTFFKPPRLHQIEKDVLGRLFLWVEFGEIQSLSNTSDLAVPEP